MRERDDELMTTIKAHEMKIQLTTKKSISNNSSLSLRG